MQAGQGQLPRPDLPAAADVLDPDPCLFSQFFDPQIMLAFCPEVNLRQIDGLDPDLLFPLRRRFEAVQQPAAVVVVIVREDHSVQPAHAPAVQEGDKSISCKILFRRAAAVDQKMPALRTDIDPVTLADIEKDHFKGRGQAEGQDKNGSGDPGGGTQTAQPPPLPVIYGMGNPAEMAGQADQDPAGIDFQRTVLQQPSSAFDRIFLSQAGQAGRIPAGIAFQKAVLQQPSCAFDRIFLSHAGCRAGIPSLLNPLPDMGHL